MSRDKTLNRQQRYRRPPDVLEGRVGDFSSQTLPVLGYKMS